MTSKCRPVVICGPSGVGKGTLIELLQKHFPDGKFGVSTYYYTSFALMINLFLGVALKILTHDFSISHTTRKPREGEQDGVHYNFTTVDAIKKEIEAGKFVEYAEVHGNYYGTSVAAVQTVQEQGKICLLDIDIQGAQNVKKSDLDALYIFISPPSMEELEKRLRGRGTEKEDAILRRLGNAQTEMDYGAGVGNFDCVLFSISHTTRKPREGEQDGVHYNFTTVDAIKEEIEAGKFVEYAEVHGNYYGTSVAAVQTVQEQGKICLLDIDIQGAQNVKKSDLDALYIFISPPSMEELEKRLRGRGTESEEAIVKRLGNAQTEMDYGAGEGNFDCVLV
eukprot:scaffold1811_cov137-Skeletonema_marinoi.AAC.14